MDELVKNSFDNAAKQSAADEFIESVYLKYEYDDEKASTKLNINELFDSLEYENWGAFAGTKINKTRYLLLKLDLLHRNLNTRIQFNKLNSSVEHIMPRKIAETEWNIDKNQHEKWLHRLGNLVLIDRRKNASLSNRLYHHKKGIYQGAIENRANTNYIFMKHSSWDISAIQFNHNRAVNLLKEYYSGNSLHTIIKLKKELSSPASQVLSLPL